MSGLREVRELHAAGQLAAAYPRVRTLLDRLDADRLAGAGVILSRLAPGEVLRHHPGTQVVRVTVSAGRAVPGAVVAPLAAEFARHGMLPDVRAGEFNGWVGELTDPSSPLAAHRPDLALCVLDPFTVFEGLPQTWSAADAERVLGERLDLIARLAASHRQQRPGSTLVLNTVPLLRHHAQQLLDLASRAELGIAWREFTSGLLRLSRPGEGVVVLDLDPVTAAGARADDPRMGVHAGSPLATSLLAGYAREVAHLARALRGDTKKCLVLDLDGTLWDGTLDADGPDGVQVGAAHRQLQAAVRQLGSQGVLVALCTKNDEERVRRALRAHPGMLLREGDFTTIAAGWGPKHEALVRIAEELGLSTGSLVFVDDTAAERDLVRSALPGTAVPALDAEPALHTDRLLADGWFDTLKLTDDDRARPERYRRRARRARLREELLDHRAFLRSLDVVVRIAPATAPDLPRIAQLTARTNRLNATGARWTTAEVTDRARTGAVLGIRAADRFGDEGLAGALFIRPEPVRWTLENLALSCRVLGREIEDACLAALVAAARDAGARQLRAHWRDTGANAAVRELYLRHGFAPERPDGRNGRNGPDGLWVFARPTAAPQQPPEHVEIDITMQATMQATVEEGSCAASGN
ncbi:HAD-IIIC family phosphatase [Streptomyces sp. RB6PN25]|uniref:HAD-IIIC family phosphatase n=1 Tax=Streptomyces humicola TaxID=2953240 RepID=A0ABT1Q2X7_9ACTN|nr:HAD-IIIC family phosphatase [Streptomyces humicola]MCQ4084286.1 HAD-IIIC family phosphatase [Streptomyces humicola]